MAASSGPAPHNEVDHITQAIGLAASWDVPMLHDIDDTISTEARAKHHEYARTHNGHSAKYYGLTFWTPNMNIFRDPRWGRGQETYLPHFEAAVREGKVWSVMGAYNCVYGEPACSNMLLLGDLLRKQWGFPGHIVSDCGAIYDIFANHKTVATDEAAASRAVKAGCDMCCGDDYSTLPKAVRQGLITEAEMDVALGRLLASRFRLGLFDPPEQVAYARIPFEATGKPVVFVNCSGSAVAMVWAAEHLPAILQAWYPGGQGGQAVAETLFGDANPAGRLPVTFYRSTADLPPFADYRMSHRTYRYFTGKPLYAFGHGLSYTKFSLTGAKLGRTKMGRSDSVKLKVNVKNSGRREGDEVVQVYFRPVKPSQPQARLALCAFTRVNVPPGKTVSVSLEIPVERFRFWDIAKKSYTVEPRAYEILIGGASDKLAQKLSFAIR